MSRVRDWFVSAAVLVLGRGKKRPRGPERERIVPLERPSPRAELAVVGLLFAAALFAVAFIVVYALDRLPRRSAQSRCWLASFLSSCRPRRLL